MDKLYEMWERQRRFTENFIPPWALQIEKIQYTKEMLLALVAEIDELLKATGKWKMHRESPSRFSRSGLIEEAVDIFKYLLNILVVFDIKPEEFVEEFERKSLVVEERYKWEQGLTAIKASKLKAAAVDLDGVLARYPENWISYLNQKLCTQYTLEDYDFELPFPEIPRHQYYELKHEFRDKGFESASVLPFEDAAEFTKELHKRGYKIIILSARPYERYKRIQSDTILWMRNHNIEYDAFLWSSKKHIKIIEEIPHLSFMVEDDPRIANQVASMGYICFLRERPYNREYPTLDGVIRVRNLMEIFSYLDSELPRDDGEKSNGGGRL